MEWPSLRRGGAASSTSRGLRAPSKLAIMPFFSLQPEIIKVLELLEPGVGGEVQLTDAIQRLIESGGRVVGAMLEDHELRARCRHPETYWGRFKASYEHFNG